MNPQADLTLDKESTFPGGAWPRWSVRAFLFWLVLACLLPGIIGATILFVYEFREGRAQLEKNTLQMARALSQAVDNQILRVEALAHGLATAGSLAHGDLASFHRQARQTLARAKLAASVVLIDRRGWQVLNTLKEFGEPLPFNGNPQLVHRVQETGEPVISDLYIGAVMRRPIMTVAVPVIVDGEVVYVLVAPILPDKFSAILKAQGIPSGWVASILDSSGTIAARTGTAGDFVGKKAASEFRRRFIAATDGVVATVSADGVPVLSVFTRSPVTNWGVGIDIPRAALEAELQDALSMLALGVAGLFAIGLGLASFVGWKIARSFRVLVPPAFALGSGETVSLPPVDVSEAAEVARAMSHAAALLNERQTALRESEEILRATFDQAGVGICHISPQGYFLHANQKLCAMLSYTEDELRQRRFVDIAYPPDRDIGVADFIRSIKGEINYFTAEKRYQRRDGTIFWVRVTASSVRDGSSGAVRFNVVIIEDVTERQTAMAEIQRLNADLENRVEARTAELEHANDALLHSNMELQQFAHATAHDLKTPLRSISGFAQLLQQEVQQRGDERLAQLSSLVVDNTRRLHSLIENLLAYTRLEAQGLPFSPTELREVVKDVITSLAVLIEETGAEVSVGDLPTLSADRLQIAQVFQNLIENGIKYNESKPPRICIAAHSRDNEWVLSVTDNGIGIDPKHHERIFEIFRRLHAYHQVPGTGIGLALCRRIVARHGGHIWVESQPGQGSTFYFSLPVRSGGELDAARQ